MICGIGPHSLYYFGYLKFWALLDVTTKINYFDDLNQNTHICIKSTADVVQNIHTVQWCLMTDVACIHIKHDLS